MNTLMFVFIHVIMLVSFLIVPRISRNDVEFGINIPSSAKSDLDIVRLRKKFYKLSSLAGVLIIVLQLIFKPGETSFMWLLITSLIVYTSIYLHAYSQMKSIKSSKTWSLGDQKVVVDMLFRKRKISISPKWYLGYLLILLVTIATALVNFKDLPDQIVVQMNSGSGDMILMDKGKAVTYLIGMQLFVLGLMTFIQTIIKRAKQSISAENVEASIQTNVSFRYIFSVILYFLGLAVGITMYINLLFSIGLIQNVKLVTTIGLVLTFIPTIVLIGASVKYGQDGSRLMDSESDVIQRDEDAFWKLGMFYYNPDDPAIFVSKRVGLGWTNNFARWQSWAMLLVLLLIIIGTYYIV